ncbi:hypothetical protein L596_007392 [Steinernema carpocapsae]|uniref:Uncharacterized protein n=1 Tax=Steinernema carpocapsae TaxID=34508 RepID=A0A4U5PA58_STECR|nr:hypothetical protein L596_007392 [Steinernema carpocapsae]
MSSAVCRPLVFFTLLQIFAGSALAFYEDGDFIQFRPSKNLPLAVPIQLPTWGLRSFYVLRRFEDDSAYPQWTKREDPRKADMEKNRCFFSVLAC